MTWSWRRALVCALVATGASCGVGAADSSGISGAPSGSTHGLTDGPAATDEGTADTSSSGGEPQRFDLNSPDLPVEPDVCSVSQDGLEVPPCADSAPPDAFEPDVQWTWTHATFRNSFVTPLVVNLTDDDNNGSIDHCDIPDVIVVAAMADFSAARVFVLSGDDGHVQFEVDRGVNLSVTPAVGDIDGDALPEIVTLDGNFGQPGRLVAFEHDGAVAWTSPEEPTYYQHGAVALHDLDLDGDVEILLGDGVFDHTGRLLWSADDSPAPEIASLPTAADLDLDGDLEVVHGRRAYHHDGSVYYSTDLAPGYPHVADFDGDKVPEVLVTNADGLALVAADGTVLFSGERPTGDPADSLVWLKPATVHDFDGDGAAELATGSANNYTVYEIGPSGPTIVWQADVADSSGSAGGTAFDFDGDGVAEAMYADESEFFVFDGAGQPLLTAPRDSVTGVEYPVVADIDDDGSAEILIVSNTQAEGEPTVQAIRDAEDRWIQARRVWNQHTYHVSNVNEDGTIPSPEPRAWEGLNTFRTNAQIENGNVCQPAG